MHQAVLVLHAHETRAAFVHRRLRRAQLIAREIRAADLADFAGADQFIERAKRVRDGNFGIGLVQLVQIDDDLFPRRRQAVFGRAPHIFGTGAAPLLVHFHPELGGDQYILAPRSERPPQKLLAGARAVNVGSIEEVDAGVQRGINRGRAGFRVDTPAEVIAAQAYQRNFAAIRCVVFPMSVPPGRWMAGAGDGMQSGYGTVKLALVVIVPPGVTMVIGPVAAPAGTVAYT